MAHISPLDRSLLDDPSAEPADLVVRIRELEELKNQATAQQAELAVRLEAATRQRHADLKVPASQQGAGVASEVAIARRESPFRGRVHLGLARALVTELPCTLAAMVAGALSEEQAIIIARDTSCLDPADRAVVDQRICGRREDGTYRFTGWGLKRLAMEVTRAVAAIDPAALVERRAKAAQERHVSIRPTADAMAYLTALLPAERAVAAVAALKQTSAAAVATGGETRSRGQVEADTLVERITGQADAAAVPVEVRLVISDQALTGGSHEPAWLTGPAGAAVGVPLTAATARGLIADAAAEGIAALRRIYADAAGRLVAMDSTRRRFEGGLAELIEVRDPVCRTPWCDAPIRHKDHVTGYAAGGPTTLVNGQGLCEACSYAKEAPGWRSVTIEDGDPDGTGLHTVRITTPAGQTVDSTAPSLPIPDELRPLRALPETPVPKAPPPERAGPRVDIGWFRRTISYEAA
jgi:hypothetical protein